MKLQRQPMIFPPQEGTTCCRESEEDWGHKLIMDTWCEVTCAAGHQTPGTPRTRDTRSSEAPVSSEVRGAASDAALPATSAASVNDEDTVIMWITKYTNILIGHIVHTERGADYHSLAVFCILAAPFCSMRALLFFHHHSTGLLSAFHFLTICNKAKMKNCCNSLCLSHLRKT